MMGYESLEGIRKGSGFAAELERLAKTLQRYCVGLGSRFLRIRAEKARRHEKQ